MGLRTWGSGRSRESWGKLGGGGYGSVRVVRGLLDLTAVPLLPPLAPAIAVISTPPFPPPREVAAGGRATALACRPRGGGGDRTGWGRPGGPSAPPTRPWGRVGVCGHAGRHSGAVAVGGRAPAFGVRGGVFCVSPAAGGRRRDRAPRRKPCRRRPRGGSTTRPPLPLRPPPLGPNGVEAKRLRGKGWVWRGTAGGGRPADSVSRGSSAGGLERAGRGWKKQ